MPAEFEEDYYYYQGRRSFVRPGRSALSGTASGEAGGDDEENLHCRLSHVGRALGESAGGRSAKEPRAN